MIEISNTAQSKIKEILDKNPGKYLCLEVDGTGCGGPYLKLSLAEPETYEIRVKVNGIDVIISDQIQRYSENTTIKILETHIDNGLL